MRATKPSKESIREINRVVNAAFQDDVGRDPRNPIVVAVAVAVYQCMPHGPGKMVTYARARCDLVGATHVRTGKPATGHDIAAEAMAAVLDHVEKEVA